MSKAGEYRFALYGRSGAGKTCVLATIEMGAIGHSSGLTCEALPVEVPKPSADLKSLNGEEEEAASLHAGKEWVVGAVAGLRSRRLPDPNPPGGITLAYRFSVGNEQRGNSIVRTIDYAGELVNPNGLAEPESLAARLKQDLESYDGFLLVAETPDAAFSEDKMNEMNAELTSLRQSFSALSQSKLRLSTPIAILLTKWDRYSTVDHKQPDLELKKASTFLADERFRSYLSLIEAIRTALVNQSDIKELTPTGLAFGNCYVFPASAFGRSDRGEGIDKPPQECRPFGVLEPFLWLADRRDQLDFENLEQCWSSLRWKFWNPLAVWRARSNADRLFLRIPHKVDKPSSMYQRVAQVKLMAAFLMGGVFLSWLAAVFLAGSVGVSLRFHSDFQSHAAKINDTQTTVTQLKEARIWFDKYRFGWHGPSIAPTASDALKKIDLIDTILDTRYWSPVPDAADEAEKAKNAQSYLDQLPNGPHATEARDIVQAWGAKVARNLNNAWLEDRKRQVETAAKSVTGKPGTLEAWSEALKDLQREFPAPTAATAEQSEQRQNLINLAANAHLNEEEKLREKEEAQRWERFMKGYLSLLDSNSYKEAVEHLKKFEPRSKDWQKLVSEFPVELNRRVDAEMAKSLKDNKFDAIRKQLASATTASHSLELILRESYPDLAKTILDGESKFLAPMKPRIDNRQDQALYDNVNIHQDLPACDEYLKGDRPKPMKAEVEKYKGYLNRRSGPLNLTVSIYVTWDQKYALGDHNIVTVYSNSTEVYKSPSYVKATPGSTSGVIGKFRLTKFTLKDSLTFKATIVEEDDWWVAGYDDDGGSGESTFTVDELVKGQRAFPLRSSDGKLKNDLILKVTEGIEEPPSLPKWSLR